MSQRSVPKLLTFLTLILVFSMRVHANYFDGRTSQLNSIEIEVVDNKLLLFLFGKKIEYQFNQIKIKDSLGSAYLSIELPNGARVECPKIKHRSELGLKSSGKFLKFLENGFLGILASLLLGVFGIWVSGAYLLPTATGMLWPFIPEAVFDQIDSITLSSLDEKILLPSTLEEAKKKEIIDYFDFLNGNSEKPEKKRLEFRATKDYLPNAFTLSGSTIVLTDDLVKLLDKKEDVGAILAHELGHQELGHVRKRLVGFSAASILVALTTGDFSNTIGLLSTALWQLKLSRQDEFEADDFGAKLVQKVGGDPTLLAIGLEKLESSIKNKKVKFELFEEAFELISTHPDTTERATRIRGKEKIQ